MPRPDSRIPNRRRNFSESLLEVYEKPTVEILVFETTDVLRCSDGGHWPPGRPDWHDWPPRPPFDDDHRPPGWRP